MAVWKQGKQGKQEKMDKVKILFVCMGNICRSPAAEAVMKKMAAEAGYADRFFIDSAGTLDYHEGEPADSRMKLCASLRGYRLTSLSRPVKADDFYTFDLIIGMDDTNIHDLRKRAPEPRLLDRIHQMTEYAQGLSYSHVPDPYCGGAEGFTLALDIIEDACRGLMDAIFSSRDN
ncbi:MAG: low molecular weight phosphotyrosine protein phosphatase [Tannerellaceae bacterium]|jgi:protein-tyrosine phosphatase|nr:low molecular weight phosphotyrosine protein phosphatase [Tannerellaceae bacterium]